MQMRIVIVNAQSESKGTVPPLYIALPDPRQRLVNNDMLEASSNFPLYFAIK